MAFSFVRANALLLLCCSVFLVFAGNPLVPRVGMADPNLHFFNGTFYMFATHDFSINNTGTYSEYVPSAPPLTPRPPQAFTLLPTHRCSSPSPYLCSVPFTYA